VEEETEERWRRRGRWRRRRWRRRRRMAGKGRVSEFELVPGRLRRSPSR
jgi:hypothetical protein